ncbi:hypothetical protein KP509_32G021100 [Ceratopteris richardii]|uniref:Uncharacterized protein n=1 Tax=Ceratopteris richardii TaxID=49495 RepID=A0A8T2QT19_CERRI|nr:hypothetical protein KP509_32G021100 [Ceratopteris richardii]
MGGQDETEVEEVEKMAQHEEGEGTVETDDDPRSGARVVRGHDACFAEAIARLQANGLPDGLLPLEDIEEVGYVEATGYFWVQQKRPKKHYFPKTGKTCHYNALITGRFENGCLLDLTGVSSKEALLLWVTIAHIFTNPAKHPGEIYFKTTTGLGRWLPADAFALPVQSSPSC